MRAPGVTSARPNLSKTMRRAIRSTAKLANELSMHSFRVHTDGTVTWTLKHENLVQPRPDPNSTGKATDSQTREPSKRTQRSRERAEAHRALHEKAQRLRATFFVRRWARLANPPSTPLVPQQQPSASSPPVDEWPPLPRLEHGQAEAGATKRRSAVGCRTLA